VAVIGFSPVWYPASIASVPSATGPAAVYEVSLPTGQLLQLSE